MSSEMIQQILQNEITELEVEIEVLDVHIEEAKKDALKNKLYERVYERAYPRLHDAKRKSAEFREESESKLRELQDQKRMLELALQLLRTKGVELASPENSVWVSEYLEQLSGDVSEDTE